MKLLCIQSGASWSTADVYNGYVQALKAQGHDVGEYLLDHRIEEAGRFLTLRWRRAGKPAGYKPRPEQIQEKAGEEAILRTLDHRPDWVLIWSGMYFHPNHVIRLRRLGARVPRPRC